MSIVIRRLSLMALLCVLGAGAGRRPAARAQGDLPEPGYSLLYALDIPVSADFNAAGAPYGVDRGAALAGPFDRVAYRLRLEAADGRSEALWVSMDAFSDDLRGVGLPTTASGAAFQGAVKAMTVVSDVPGLPVGSDLPGGWLELWPSDYSTANSAGAPGADDSLYDWGDAPTGGGNYGSFQIHDSASGKTLMAYNHWGQAAGAAADIGIGSRPTGHPDWTFAANAAAWVSRRLEVYVRSQASPADHVLSEPLPRSVRQRDALDRAEIPVAGAFAEGVGAVEARAVSLRPPLRSTEWRLIDAAPQAGRFGGRLSVPVGWWRLEVRAGAAVEPERLLTGRVAPVGVGEVFITAGQSNSANHGSPPQRPADDRVSAWGARGAALGGWRQGADPQPVATGSGGSPWPAMGDALAASLDLPIGIASVGWGGTTVAQWLPDRQLYPRLKQAMAGLGGAGGFRAVLWHQGESDAVGGTSTAAYAADLTRLIEQSRADAGGPVPWLVAEVSFAPNLAQPPRDAVIAAQRQVVASVADVHAGPGTDDLAGAEWRFDGIHFGAAGLALHGRRWAQALAASGILPAAAPPATSTLIPTSEPSGTPTPTEPPTPESTVAPTRGSTTTPPEPALLLPYLARTIPAAHPLPRDPLCGMLNGR